MTDENQSIQFEDIEHTPAATLLALRYTALNRLIREAERRVNQAEMVANWLRGIKVEKSFREDPRKTEAVYD